MRAADHTGAAPRSVIVVGAGIVGLSTAWFLQEHGVEITVIDRVGVGAGASSGNAGWIAPALAIPLNEPDNVRFGVRSLLSPTAPLQVPLAAVPALGMFLVRFAVNSRPSAWRRAVRANVGLNAECLQTYDILRASGVDAPMTAAPITALFRTPADAERLLDELRRFSQAGLPVSATELDGAALTAQLPLASPAVSAAVRIDGQRFLDPAGFVAALGEAVVDRGATLRTLEVIDVATSGAAVTVRGRDGTTLSAAAAVIATGAWLPGLTSRWIRVPVRAGRGYSFTVPIDTPGQRADVPAGRPGGLYAVERSATGRRNHGVRRPGRPDRAGSRRCHRRFGPPTARRCALGGTHRRLGRPAPGQPRRTSVGGAGVPA